MVKQENVKHANDDKSIGRFVYAIVAIFNEHILELHKKILELHSEIGKLHLRVKDQEEQIQKLRVLALDLGVANSINEMNEHFELKTDNTTQ